MTNFRSPVVVTGAAGNLGSRVVPWLEAAGREVRPVDRRRIDHPHATLVDLTEPGDWGSWMSGARAVIHLAGVPSPTATSTAVEGPNVTATRNLVHVAKAHGVERLVLASSVWVMRGRWDAGGVMTAGAADPGENHYGRSKARAEDVVARGVGAGLSVVVLRIGGRAAGDARPRRLDPWEDACWLGWQDLLHGIDCAVDARVDGLATVNLVSGNPAGRWSQDEAREQIGFVASESFNPEPTAGLLKKVYWRLRRR